MANIASLDLESASSQYGSVSDSASLSVTGDMTMECWVKLETVPSVVGNNFAVISKEVTPTQASYRLLISTINNKPYIMVSSDGAAATYGNGNTAIQVGSWTHIAAVYTASSGECVFYNNGVVDGTATGLSTAIFDGTAPFFIGADDIPAVQYYDGLIDDVRIWATARSAGNIATNYLTELVGNEANLQAYYKFNNVATDSTANANNLGLQNAPVYSTDIPFGRSTSGLQSKYW